jgi:transglutaminase-like putative cysteine protease
MTSGEKLIRQGNSLLERDLYLKPTYFIDSDSKAIKDLAISLTGKYQSPKGKARALFYFVRDEIAYDPCNHLFSKENYRASATLYRREGNCIHKAVLLTALARAVGIPAKLGFKDIKNHMTSYILMNIWGGNEFPFHGYSELWLDDKWVVATPAFNKGINEKYNLETVDFDGERHVIFSDKTKGGEPHIEYIRDRGVYDDLPFEVIMKAFLEKIVILSVDMMIDLKLSKE